MTILDFIYKFAAGYVALTAGLFMLSYVVPKAGFVARLLGAYVSLCVASSYGVVASIFLRLTGEPGISQWATAQSFKIGMALTTGVTFEVVDPKNILGTLRPAVFVGNHQTELDVLMLACMFPKYCSITAKASLKRWPFLGWFMTLSGSIFIDRKNTKDARQAMQGAADQIRQRRQSVYMFPEGTRSYSKEPTLLPFKKGAFHLAIEAGVPIVPCVVSNYSHILWIKGMVFKSGKIPIKGWSTFAKWYTLSY
jgi:lysophosphatidate acyltransferase